MGATTVMEFTDRIFLGRYSLDALAASMPAGITSFLFMLCLMIFTRFHKGKWKTIRIIKEGKTIL